MEEQNPLRQIVDILSSAGHILEARDFEQQISKLASSNNPDRIATAQAIVDRCHPRWLGDLFIEKLSLQEWWGLLEQASRFAKHRSKTT